jgi:hypothetical protein
MKFQGRKQKGRFRTLSFISRKHFTDAHSVEESIGKELTKEICKKRSMNYSVDLVYLVYLVYWVNQTD